NKNIKKVETKNDDETKHSEMYACMCTDMAMPSSALSLAIWRLCRTGRSQDARERDKLMNVLLRLLEEDPSLKTEPTFSSNHLYPKEFDTDVYDSNSNEKEKDKDNENKDNRQRNNSMQNRREETIDPYPRNPTIARLHESDPSLPPLKPRLMKHLSDGANDIRHLNHVDQAEDWKPQDFPLPLVTSSSVPPPSQVSAVSVPGPTNNVISATTSSTSSPSFPPKKHHWTLEIDSLDAKSDNVDMDESEWKRDTLGRLQLQGSKSEWKEDDAGRIDPDKRERRIQVVVKANKATSMKRRVSDPLCTSMQSSSSSSSSLFAKVKATIVPFSERKLDVAMLHSAPLEGETALDLGLERDKLEYVFRRTQRRIGVFFGVLTKQSLMMCIQRGAQIVHISGHGPNAQMLQVENGRGGMEIVTSTMIKAALTDSLWQLKLVFVSTCFSEQVASAFVEAGVPHVVAVHSLVQIHDKVAIAFAQSFYEHLLGNKNVVLDAFKNAQAQLKLQDKDDCCCRHEGHKEECLCPYCKQVRCCKIHHSASCPGAKFLLLGKDDHKEQVLCDANTTPLVSDDELIQPIVHPLPTNFAQGARDRSNPMTVLGRQEDIRNLVELLHPDGIRPQDMVVLCGPKYVGCTTVGQGVAQFFTRPWYTPIFPGGVWWIDLRPLVDPDRLFGFIADRMAVGIDRGRFQYRDPGTNQMMDYPKDIHDQICSEQYKETPNVIHYIDEVHEQDHYILFRAHKYQDQTLHARLEKDIYVHVSTLFKKCSLNEFPKEVWKDHQTGTVQSRRIIFKPMDEPSVLAQIKQKCHGPTLFILDHLEYKEDQLKRFLTTLNSLSNEIHRVRILLICHSNIYKQIEAFDRLRFQYRVDCRVYRLKAISNVDACRLLRIRFAFHFCVWFTFKERNTNILQIAQDN
ncbi:hypothetical protein RFI_01212, partial [Reticulomyxa filosa]